MREKTRQLVELLGVYLERRTTFTQLATHRIKNKLSECNCHWNRPRKTGSS